MGEGGHHDALGLPLLFLLQPPPWAALSGQWMGWGSEEGSCQGGGGGGEGGEGVGALSHPLAARPAVP